MLNVTAAAAKLLQSCPTLRDPIDGSPPGSAIPGILQAQILEWVSEVNESFVSYLPNISQLSFYNSLFIFYSVMQEFYYQKKLCKFSLLSFWTKNM